MDSIIENITFLPCNPANCGGKRKKEDILYLVYHYTGNDGDTARSNAVYYANTVVEASAHYFVDDDSVYQSVGDLTVAWAVGGTKWADCAQTGGGKLHGIVTNANSISIEMCDTCRDGTIRASDRTLDNAVALGRLLMERYNIPLEHVVRHFDVTGKHCPAYFMDNAVWGLFKSQLVEEEVMEKKYQTLEEIKKEAPWAYDTVKKLVSIRALRGDGEGLDLSLDMLRLLVINDRAGAYRYEVKTE